jgi:hypothetical protein
VVAKKNVAKFISGAAVIGMADHIMSIMNNVSPTLNGIFLGAWIVVFALSGYVGWIKKN